jgi:hypothetical protein
VPLPAWTWKATARWISSAGEGAEVVCERQAVESDKAHTKVACCTVRKLSSFDGDTCDRLLSNIVNWVL